jgi:hypothetical protein
MQLKDLVIKITVEKSFHVGENKDLWFDPFNMNHVDHHFSYNELISLTSNNYIPF